jgi:hypothetical protein
VVVDGHASEGEKDDCRRSAHRRKRRICSAQRRLAETPAVLTDCAVDWARGLG